MNYSEIFFNISALNNTTTTTTLQTATSILTSSTCILAALANLLTIIAFLSDKRCWSSFNVYLFNLACTDFLITTLDAPFTISINLLPQWTFGFKTCSFYLYVDWVLFAGVYFSVMLITVDRLHALFFPVHYHRQQRNSVRSSGFVCVCMWIIVHLVTCPFLAIDRTSAVDESTCFVNGPNQQLYGIALLALTNWLPIAVICLGYLCIWRKMRARVAEVDRVDIRAVTKATDRKLYWTVGGLTLCTLCGWVPGVAYFTLTTISDSFANAAVYGLVFCLNYLICLIDPIVYDYNVPEIRRAVVRLLKC